MASEYLHQPQIPVHNAVLMLHSDCSLVCDWQHLLETVMSTLALCNHAMVPSSQDPAILSRYRPLCTMHKDAPCVQAQSGWCLQADWQEQELNTEVAEPLTRAVPGQVPPQRGVSDASALISHFDDWANVLDGHEVESSLSRRGSGKLEGLEPDALRNTVDGLLKRQPVPSKLQPQAPTPAVLILLRPCC